MLKKHKSPSLMRKRSKESSHWGVSSLMVSHKSKKKLTLLLGRFLTTQVVTWTQEESLLFSLSASIKAWSSYENQYAVTSWLSSAPAQAGPTVTLTTQQTRVSLPPTRQLQLTNTCSLLIVSVVFLACPSMNTQLIFMKLKTRANLSEKKRVRRLKRVILRHLKKKMVMIFWFYRMKSTCADLTAKRKRWTNSSTSTSKLTWISCLVYLHLLQLVLLQIRF